jgi:hypothetical protein
VPNFQVSFSDFDPKIWKALSGAQTQSCSWARILHSAVTVGRANTAHVMRHGRYSWFELTYRVAMVLANLKETASGQIISTRAYRTLDPSEKGAVSYFLGLTVAKLLAGRRLRVHWLMHLDAYKDIIKVTHATISKRRPDLFGLTSASQWVAIEGKGRSGLLPKGLMSNAKGQAKNIGTVNGAPPLCRVAALTGFDGFALYTEFSDPPEQTERLSIAVNLPETEYLRRYYQTLISAIKEAGAESFSTDIDGKPHDGIRLQRFDTFIGISRRLRMRLEAPEPISAAEIGELVGQNDAEDSGMEPDAREGATCAGQDGIAVRLGDSWNTDQLRLEPADRKLELG